MRTSLAGFVILACVGSLAAEAPARRFGVEANLKNFPQSTPQQTLGSVLKAIDLKRPDYIIAHLADPEFVDGRVKVTSHAELLDETTAKLITDPGAVKLLQRYVKEGEWTTDDDSASVRLKDSERGVFFRKAGGRWFLRQPYRAKNEKKARPE